MYGRVDKIATFIISVLMWSFILLLAAMLVTGITGTVIAIYLFWSKVLG